MIQFTPSRRLLEMVRRLREAKQSTVERDLPHVTTERVESVNADGSYAVRKGRAIPATGEASLRAGQMVPVGWRDGKPVAIISHSARRAQFSPTLPVLGGGVVEELFALNFDGSGREVYFRNDHEIVSLKVRETLSVSEKALFDSDFWNIKWGKRADSFFFRAGDKFFVYKLKRNPSKILGSSEKIKTPPELVRVYDATQINFTLGSGHFVFDRIGASHWPKLLEVWTPSGGCIPPYAAVIDLTYTGEHTPLPDNSHSEFDFSFFVSPQAFSFGGITGAFIGILSAVVNDAMLDENLNLFVAYGYGVAGFDPRTSLSEIPQSGEHKTYTSGVSDWSIVDIPLTPHPAMSFSVSHRLIVNLTTGTLVYNSMAPSFTITDKRESHYVGSLGPGKILLRQVLVGGANVYTVVASGNPFAGTLVASGDLGEIGKTGFGALGNLFGGVVERLQESYDPATPLYDGSTVSSAPVVVDKLVGYNVYEGCTDTLKTARVDWQERAVGENQTKGFSLDVPVMVTVKAGIVETLFLVPRVAFGALQGVVVKQGGIVQVVFPLQGNYSFLYQDGNGYYVNFTAGLNVSPFTSTMKLYSVKSAVLRDIGSGEPWVDHGLVFMEPDFLYSLAYNVNDVPMEDPRNKTRFFVSAGKITSTEDSKFPPKDTVLDPVSFLIDADKLKTLKDFWGGQEVPAPSSHVAVHVVPDRLLLGPLGRFKV